MAKRLLDVVSMKIKYQFGGANPDDIDLYFKKKTLKFWLNGSMKKKDHFLQIRLNYGNKTLSSQLANK